MTITQITHRKNNLVILFNTGEEIKIVPDVSLNHFLYVGKELSIKEVEKIKEENISYKVYAYALLLLSRQAYSKKEMREKLMKKEENEEVIKLVLQKLEYNNLINDETYAFNKVEHLFFVKHKSKKAIIEFLKTKGINSYLIEDTIAKFTFNDEEHVRVKITKLLKSYVKLSHYQAKEKIVLKLKSEGYAYEVIDNVHREFVYEDYINERDNCKRDATKLMSKKNVEAKDLAKLMYNELRKKGYPSALVQEVIKEINNYEN